MVLALITTALAIFVFATFVYEAIDYYSQRKNNDEDSKTK